MNNVKNTLILKTCAASLVAFGLSLSSIGLVKAHHYVPTYEECEALGNKITICHATSSETNPYVEETIACEALYGKNGNAGHFSENGTTLAGHEDDYVLHEGLSCGVDPSPTPSPTGTPNKGPIVEPTATSTNRSSSQSEGRQSSLANDNLQCTNKTFDAIMDVKDNGVGVRDVLVRFFYNGSTKENRTNESGRAKVNFDQNGNGNLTATAEGYPAQSMYITTPQCSPVALDPDKSKSSPMPATAQSSGQAGQGQVLGATTLANTGSGPVYSMMSLFFAGVMMTMAALYGYSQDKKSQN